MRSLDTELQAFAALIPEIGTVKPWPRYAEKPRYNHPYLIVDGFEYWTMGAPVEETTVINRAVPGGRYEAEHPTPPLDEKPQVRLPG